jgi:hypothetical protein
VDRAAMGETDANAGGTIALGETLIYKEQKRET